MTSPRFVGDAIATPRIRADTEVMELSEESKLGQEKHAEVLRKLEEERRARTMTVPTKNEDVALKLRSCKRIPCEMAFTFPRGGLFDA